MDWGLEILVSSQPWKVAVGMKRLLLVGMFNTPKKTRVTANWYDQPVELCAS